MATNTPTSLVALGRAGTGAAVTFGNEGYRPLEALMKTEALQQRLDERARIENEKKKQASEKDFAANIERVKSTGFLEFQDELDQDRQTLYGEMEKVAKDPTLSRGEKSIRQRKLATELEAKTERTLQIESRTKEVGALADTSYDKPALVTAIHNTFFDPETKARRKLGDYDVNQLDALLDNPKYFNQKVVAKKFADTVFQKDELFRSTAARPGRTGSEVRIESRGLELDPETREPIRDPLTGQFVINGAAVIEDARKDRQVNRIIESELEQYRTAVNTVAAKIKADQPVTPEEQALVEQEATKPKGYVDFLNDFLSQQVYNRQSTRETFRPAPAAPRPRAAAKPVKPAASQVQVTPTVGFQSSSYVPEPEGWRGKVMKSALGITPAKQDNYYPTVGETFGSAQNPYAEITVDNQAAEVVGQNGKVTRLTSGNGKVPMKLVSRDYVLYVNGKRLGRKDAFASDTDAYDYLQRKISELTPAQAQKAELRTEYRGTLTDKTKTANDGAGGRPKATGRTESGKAIYDTGVGEEELSVIVKATQAGDAQLQKASGGQWDPRRPTAEQVRVIEALRRKGGRVVDPYSRTAPAASAAPKKGPTVPSKGPLAQEEVIKVKRAPATAPKDPRLKNKYGLQF